MNQDPAPRCFAPGLGRYKDRVAILGPLGNMGAWQGRQATACPASYAGRRPACYDSLSPHTTCPMKQTLAERLNNPRNRLARFYDNGGESADRFTAVYLERRSDSWYSHRTMSESPYHPTGVCLYGATVNCTVDFPHVRFGRKHKFLGKRIGFSDLPKVCQGIVLRDVLLDTDSLDSA